MDRAGLAALMDVLYVSYDGALDPLGQSQVVPYLEGLSGLGYRFSLITFEKPKRFADAAARRALETRLERSDIGWHPLPYTKRPPVLSTAVDLARGVRRGRDIAVSCPLRLVHARSYPSSVIAQAIARRSAVPWIFDMRGFYPEERTDGGLWRADGVVYRVAKRLEAGFLKDAGAVVTLTEASLAPLTRLMADVGARAPVHVIPTCVDLDRFAALPRPQPPFTLAYFGSIGTWYLLDEMMALGRVVLERADRSGDFGVGRLLFVVNQEGERVRAAAARAGVADRVEIRSVAHERVPEALADAWATYFLIRPGGSKVASAATKFGESLALGRPVLANRGIGDSARVIETDGVGVVLEGFSADERVRCADALLTLAADPEVGARCRATADRRYALADGVAGYARVYRELIGEPVRAGRAQHA
jgi:glycosyltransferase involved in cell wall biosynthesis